MDDLNLRLQFHNALDPVAPPAPWLAEHVRSELQRRRGAGGRQARQLSRFRLFGPTTRLIAAALVLIIAGTATAVAIAIYYHEHHVIPVIPRPGAVTRECGQYSLHMVDPNIGWNGTSRSTDGGKTWHDVSPPAVPGWVKGPNAICTLDADHAWSLSSTGGDPYAPTQVVLLSTHDGGQSWQQVGAIAVPFTVSWQTNFSAEMDFLDDQHGWLLMEYASRPFQRVLYATVDGGVHWSVVSRLPGLGLGDNTRGCNENGIMFASLTRGWLTWTCNAGYGDQPPGTGPVIASTNNGGQTWDALRLPSYPNGSAYSCGANTPIFSRDEGVFELICGGFGQAGQDIVYSSADGGQTWVAHPLSDFATVDFINGTTGFYVWNAAKTYRLYRTKDGGAHWVVVAAGLFPGAAYVAVTFFDDKTGFADVGGPSPLWTNDGGKTWSLPAPYHSVGNTICPLFSDPGVRQSPVAPHMFSPTVGWAGGTRRTADGGSTWSNVGPPSPNNRSAGYGEFYLDGTHAWVADAIGSATACADHFVVYMTGDGGATWQEGAHVAIQLADAGAMLSGDVLLSVDFVDSGHGWVIAQPGYVSGPRFPVLYSTADGGKHWTLVTAQAGSTSPGCYGVGRVEFASTAHGFMGGACIDQNNTIQWRVLVTHDGGFTWNVVNDGLDTCCSNRNALPVLIDATHAWIFDQGANVLTMTSDAGTTWVRYGLPPFTSYTCQGKFGPTTCSNQSIVTGSFIGPTEGWLIVSDYPGTGSQLELLVERTVNGGGSWAVVYTRSATTTDDLGGNLTFVDQNNGFWWLGSTLLQTTDGGHTWTEVHVTYS